MNTGVSKLSDQLPSLNLRTEVGFCGDPIKGGGAGNWNTAGVVRPVPIRNYTPKRKYVC